MIHSVVPTVCLGLWLCSLISGCAASHAVSWDDVEGTATCAFIGRIAFAIGHWRQYDVPLSTVYAVAPKHAAYGVRRGLLDHGGLTSQQFLEAYMLLATNTYANPVQDPHAIRLEAEQACFAAWRNPDVQGNMQWIKQ